MTLMNQRYSIFFFVTPNALVMCNVYSPFVNYTLVIFQYILQDGTKEVFEKEVIENAMTNLGASIASLHTPMIVQDLSKLSSIVKTNTC
jgi:tRNA A-37 threonylcarbamoyl transferase component Bud32